MDVDEVSDQNLDVNMGIYSRLLSIGQMSKNLRRQPIKLNTYKGSYKLSAPVLLNLLNKLGNRDKMQDWPSILSLFPNLFNKFNTTGAQMLDSVYHMTPKNTLKNRFLHENTKILPCIHNLITAVNT